MLRMDRLWILGLILSVFSVAVVAYRNDLSSTRHGCIWSTVESFWKQDKEVGSTGTVLPANGVMLNCHLRTLSVDFWNYTFNRDQLEQTKLLRVKCNDKLFFESFLTPNQTLFQLANLREVQIESCKIRKVPRRVWASLSFLKSLVIRTQNVEWSGSVGLEIETGGFDGLSQLETLDLSQNNIWSFPDKNILCPLRNLLKLNVSGNRLSDMEELSSSEESTESTNGDNYCALSVQNLDLSFNALRRVSGNAFSRMRRLTELRFQNNYVEELEDSAFSGLSQLKLLNLSSNRLVALPPSIFKSNSNLREMYLQNNSISALSAQVFSKLEHLLLLDLSHNTLTSQWVKDNMFHGLIRLVVLKLSFNQLSHVDPTILHDLISLQALHLDNNRIESINPEAFNSLSNLHILDLSNNRLSFIDSRIFTNLFVLRQLYLDHNKIRNMEEKSLKNCTSLQDLGLADNLLQEVPVALHSAGLGLLRTLDIGENRIVQVSNESFAGMGQLYGLRMVDNRLTELPSGFCEPLKKLRVLNLAQNRINKVSSTSFSACPELRALRLDTNAMEELPTTLAPQLPSLLWLNVSENRLRWADYHLLPPTIEWLDLSYNSLESLGGPAGSLERNKNPMPYHLRVLDASYNKLITLDHTTIPPSLETLRVNHNQLKTVATDTFIRSTRLRRVELIGNQIENLPLAALRFPPIPSGRPLPEFYLGANPFLCDCSMEWLTRVNQLSVLRQHPRIVDLDAIVCRPTFSRSNQMVPLVETRPKDFLCPYKSHCFALCHCCDFDACDCEMTCPGNCTCYHDTAWSSNIVQCSNLQYTNIPQRIPMDATVIYLDGNNIPQLGSHIFIGKKNLRTLFLNDSRIESIKNKTFNGLKSLEILRLEENQLTELHGYEFADLENLRELYLQNNLLRFIAPDSFIGLKFLQVLRLDGNLLVDFNVWELSGNGYLNSVMLSGNPWSCECEFLIPFRTWVASKTTILVDFALAKCMMVNNSNSLPSGGSNDDTQIQVQPTISSMCNTLTDISFNYNANAEDTEINNHISAMGGAEKVAVLHPPENELNFSPPETDINMFWTLVLTLSGLIILVVVIILIFRKEIFYWCFSRVTDSLGFCCTAKSAKKPNQLSDDVEKLFDAYFLYSKRDEDLLLQKIAPELEVGNGAPTLRLCLHYRDLCLNSDNPWNTDMILSACDASKRVVIVLSRTFLHSEWTNAHFRASLQSSISLHQKKLIFVLLPPFTEQNLSTIYPELKGSSINKNNNSYVEWSDKNFWTKFKLFLPTPQFTFPTTNSDTISNTQTLSSIHRQHFPYNSNHHYHRNIIPYQIPMGRNNSLPSSVPKHQIVLPNPLHWQSNNGSFPHQAANIIPSAAIHPVPPELTPQHFGYNNEGFHHLQSHHQHAQHQQQLPQLQHHQLQPIHFSHEHQHQHQHSLCSNSNSYRPMMEQNYSSSAVSSANEELDHVYSTLDSPLQSPTSAGGGIHSDSTYDSSQVHRNNHVNNSKHQIQHSTSSGVSSASDLTTVTGTGPGSGCENSGVSYETNKRTNPNNNNNLNHSNGRMYFV